MLKLLNFEEREHAMVSSLVDLETIDVSKLELLVRAHEKEIYDYNDHMIIAKPHIRNDGKYPFSKMDFLSHQLLQLIFPLNVPKLYAASFKENEIFYVVEKIKLDPLHQAYNIFRQQVHQSEGLDYHYNPEFLNTDAINTKVTQHVQKVNNMQMSCADNLKTYGITFDHSYVNITWRNGEHVALEIHKCQRPYLFDYDQCLAYFNGLSEIDSNKEIGLSLLKRIKELEQETPKES